jgi:DNA-binding GntR family transcriptional regulator
VPGDDDLRELHLAELILECAGVRHAPCPDVGKLEALRAANARLLAAGSDPAAAVRADEEFHGLLVSGSLAQPVLATLGPLRRRLRPYRSARLAAARHVRLCVVQHEAIIGALERCDRRGAERGLRHHQAIALGQLEAQPA